MTHKRFEENEEKFRELLLYVCAKCATHRKFGAIKLNKILFYADFLAYRRLGQPITGVEYQKLEKGPAPRRLIPIRKEMIAQGDLAIQPRETWGMIQERPINLRSPRLALFTAEQIALVDTVIEKLRGLTADQTSELSHRYLGWRAMDIGETIPYETAFISAYPPTAKDRERAALVERDCATLLREIA